MKEDLLESQMTDPKDVARFIYAGRALFTMVSQKTGARYTYKVSKSRTDKESNLRFVKVLSGPNNETDYGYLGYIDTRKPGVMFPGKKGKPGATSYKAIAFVIAKVTKGVMPEHLEFYHSGQCGCCGRTLTVPESIKTGLGPVCAGKH